MNSVIELYWFLSTKIHFYFHDTFIHEFVKETWSLFTQLWFFLFSGIFLSSLLSVFFNAEQVAHFFYLRNEGLRPTLFLIGAASFVGIISPMPIYVVIPLVIALFKVGVSSPILFAFLISSPLMNPVLFTVTAGALGLEMAFARSLSAMILGMIAGYTLYRLNLSGKLNKIFSNRISVVDKRKYAYERTISSFFQVFFYEFYRLMRFAGKYFLIGIMTAAAVKILMPAELIIKMLGNRASISVLLAVAAGVPLYACGGGTIPVMKVLMALGMNKGAILAFFISGPATKISTLVTLNAAMKKNAFLVYLAIAFSGAMFLGLIYNIL